LSCSRLSERRYPGRGIPSSALRVSAAALLGLLSLISCKDDISAPPDRIPPSAVTDLHVTSKDTTSVELGWTAPGDDGAIGQADRCQICALPGRTIESEADWNSAIAAASSEPAAAPPGTIQTFRFQGLQADSLYGFALRVIDPAGNASPLSNSIAVRTNPRPAADAGFVDVHLHSLVPGAYRGTSVAWESTVLVAEAQDSVYSFPFPPGPVTLRVVRDCAQISPAAEQQVTVASGLHQSLFWQVDPTGAVTVISSPPGADILVDGIAVQLRAPATLECLSPGSHDVRVRWSGISVGADSVRSIEVGPQPVRLEFHYPRSVLLELVTATLCTNCPIADAAAESLWTQGGFPEGRYVGLEVHAAWGGSDPFATATTINRSDDFYHAGSQLPWAFMNGGWNMIGLGSPAQGIPGMMETYGGQARSILEDTNDRTPVAMTWSAVTRTPGSQLTGSLHVVVIETVEDPEGTEVWALDYKDRLVAFVPTHQRNETFYKVVREYTSLGTLAELGLRQPGDQVTLHVSFPLGWDTRWPEGRMGVVAFVQHTAGQVREIYQVAHAPAP
jgi:hypothetical protein